MKETPNPCSLTSERDPSLSDMQSKASTPEHRETLGHRLRTSLHTIIGYTGLVRSTMTGPGFDHLGIVESSAREMLALIEELPSMSRPIAAFGAAASVERPQGPQPSPLAALATSDVAALRRLLQMGRLFQIERWANDLMARQPEHVTLAQSIIALTHSANLPALEKLLPAEAEL